MPEGHLGGSMLQAAMQTNLTDPSRKPEDHAAAWPQSDSVPAVQAQAVERVDTSFLEALVGYNARRAALAVIGAFIPQMAEFGLRPVEFSVLCLIRANPGITARQLGATLDIQPPNLVGMIKTLEKRDLLEKRDHPRDRRAQGLHLTTTGESLMAQAQETWLAREVEATPGLTQVERLTLNRLLRKVYQPDS